MPEDENPGQLSAARNYLALSFLILAGISFVSYFMKSEAENQQLLSALTLWIGSYQALLFTLTSITFIQPVTGRRGFAVKQIMLITVVGVPLLMTSLLSPEKVFPHLFYPAIGFYLFQLVYYTRSFRNAYNKSLAQMEAYYDDEEYGRLQWVKFCFYSALGIGVLVLFTFVFNNYFYCAFIVIYTVYYAYVISRFYNYITDMKFLIPALVEKRGKIDSDPPEVKLTEEEEKSFLKNKQALSVALEQWVEEKNYCEGDVSVEDIVRVLGTDTHFFRYYFREVMQIDFRTWRIKLRIAEAKKIMESNPSITLEQLAKITGFNHRANFYRQFQKITGESPSDYKKRL
jgi:AraC-type DNA-binding domain-containing proteins